MKNKEYKNIESSKVISTNENFYITMPSFMQDNNSVKMYELHKNDIIEYSLDEFLKPCNINVMMKYFKVIGYNKYNDYYMIKLFGKYRRINKPFKYIKYVKLEFLGE